MSPKSIDEGMMRIPNDRNVNFRLLLELLMFACFEYYFTHVTGTGFRFPASTSMTKREVVQFWFPAPIQARSMLSPE